MHMPSTEIKWACLWGGLIVAFVVAETVAIKSNHPHAPLSHHVRKHTRIVGKHPIGQVALHLGANWLHKHLYQPVDKAMKGM